MRTMKKGVSLLLTVLMLAMAVCVPMTASAEDAYKIEKETTLTRFIPAVKAFEAGETKTFEFTADTTAEYALFTMSGGSSRGTTVFTFTEKETGEPVPFTFRENQVVPNKMTTANSYSHAHYNAKQYERVGNISEVKVSLTKDTTYMLSLSREAALAQFNYVDLRCLTLPITGGKQEIAPIDHTSFTSSTTTHLTEQLDYTTRNLSTEYALIGNYNDSSVFSSPYGKVRTYMISEGSSATYKLDVQKESYYRVHYTTSTWKSASTIKEGSVHKFNVPFAVDGANVNTLVYSFTAPKDGASLDAQVLTTDVFKLTEGEHTITFGPAGNPGSYAYGIYIEELPDYDPDAIETILLEKPAVKVDSVLSRFEFDEALTLSESSDIYQVKFTPELTGEYAVFLYNNLSCAHTLNIAVSDSEGNEVYNVSRALKNNLYVRFGDNQYTAIPMTAGETYTITLSGINNEIKTSYLDLRLVNGLPVPVSGKFMISPSDYAATTIGSSHMSQQFNAIAYKNADYPIIGNYFSSSLKSPRTSTTTIHHGNATVVSYALDIAEAGYYRFSIPELTVYPGSAKAESVQLSVNGVVVGEEGWTGTATDVVFDACYLAQGSNLITFRNMTVPYVDADGKEQTGESVGAYIRAILGEKVESGAVAIPVTTTTETDTNLPFTQATATAGGLNYNQAGYFDAPAGASVTFTLDVAEEGTYAVYVDSISAQKSEVITIDGEDRTSYAYDDQKQKENVQSAHGTRIDKKLSYPVTLTKGTHTVTLTFRNGLKWDDAANKTVDITAEENYVSKLYKMWVRRVDITPSETETMYLRSWDFVGASYLDEAGETSNCAGWLMVHQYNQGGRITLNNFTDVRNMVFINGAWLTYRINAPKAGYYTVSSYIGVAAGSENLITLTAAGQAYQETHVGTGSGDAAVVFENVYLDKGINDIKFQAPASCKGTMRMFGISIATETNDFVKTSENSAIVSANLEDAYTGTVIVALYGADNALVGLKTDMIESADYYVAEVAVTDAPAKAKVMVWKDTATTFAPLCDAIDFTNTNENWK